MNAAGGFISVEFCSTASGGGRSPHTRKALKDLAEAMIKDAHEKPDGIPQFPEHLKEKMLRGS
jgi:hypothetical protein